MTEPERNLQLCQLFTPDWLARRMASWVPDYATVLEPSFGSGRLISPLLARGHDASRIMGMEVDRRWVEHARGDALVSRCRLECLDFLSDEAYEVAQAFRPNVVLMNPPFDGNQHLEFVLRALEIAPVVVGVFPVSFEYTKARDAALWRERASVTRRAILPRRVKYAGAGGKFESCVLRIARRENRRLPGEQRYVTEETWIEGEPDGVCV